MEKIIFSLLIFLFLSSSSFSQNYNWITPNKPYLKLYVVDDGIYRINRTDFSNAGINTSNIDPRTVKVYNKGVQIPIYFQGEQDGVFDANDYFDFYGTRTYGGLTKAYNENNQVVYTKDEYYNLYSDTNVYWVDWGKSNGIRFNNPNYSVLNLYPETYVLDKLHFEKDKIYSLGERADGNDFRNFNNEIFQGEGWYWAQLFSSQLVLDAFSSPLLSTIPQTCYIKLFAYPLNKTGAIFNEHTLEITINGNTIANVSTNDLNRIDTTISFSSSLLSNSFINTIIIQYFSSPGFTGFMYIDMFEVQYPKIFQFWDNQFSSNLNSSDTTSKLFKVSGYTSANPISIYDVNNNIRISNYSTNEDTLIFTGKSNAKFEIINKTITKKPFRIIQKEVPNLASNSNGADYLVIYNSLFEYQVEQLKNHRETFDDFRFAKAEIQDIYDIFNYGLEDPVAVRNFVKYVYDNWQLPKLKYVCLFGRGSLDPKQNSSTTIYYKNLVPVYGNPTTDSYFANFNIGGFTYFDQVAIGRLPAYTYDEAQTMIENIITYESQPPDSWWKTSTFIIGGGTSFDQIFFQGLINPLINAYIIPPTISGNPHKIYRNDTITTVTYNYKDSIRKDIDRGSLIVNFQGHAGNQDWEDGMQDPSTLNNYNKLPLVFSMTCYTGKTAEPGFRVFGERFMNLSNRGCIGFVGSSGWGFAFSGNNLQRWMLYAIARDTLRRFGDILKYGISKLLYDSLSSSVRHTINCYGLIGDPAIKLALPIQPEFSITDSEYKLSDDFPTINEPVTLTIYPKNFGLFADSCDVRFNLKKNNITYLFYDTLLKNFKYSDSARFNFKLDSISNYSIQVILDNNIRYPNENKNNNIIQINIPLKDISYIPLKPVDNSVIKTDSIEFVGLNPNRNPDQNNIKVILQFDTTKMFNSPLKRTFLSRNINGVTTKFKIPIPILNSSILYYWRTNAVINNDSSGWTKVQTFTYNPNLNSLTNISKDNSEENILTDTNNITISKSKYDQFSQFDFYNTNFSLNGIALNDNTLNLIVRSWGSNGAETSYFTVNDKNINIDGGRSTGLNMLKVKRLNGHIIEFMNFTLTSSSSSDSVVNFLNTFDSTYYLMALNASYVEQSFVNPLSSIAKQKIKAFGSTKIDTINKFGWFDTWSFIGYLGATAKNVSEDVHLYTTNGWIPAISTLDKTYKDTYGTVSNIIGPAQSWNDFSWDQIIFPQSNILFDVIGIERNGSQSVLLSNQNHNQFINLNSLNSYRYPQLNLLAKFSIDTISGNQSSILNSLKANYNAPAEIVLNKNSLKLSDTSLKIGDELKINFDYYNVGYTSVSGVIVNVYKSSIASQNIIKSDTVIKDLKVDSLRNYYNKFTIPYFRLSSNDKTQFYIEVLPKGHYNEFYTYNNSVSFSVTIKNISFNSLVDVYSDGELIKDGDYVRAKPEMKINIAKSNSTSSLLSDTTQLFIKLNDIYVPYFIKGITNSEFKLLDKESTDRGTGASKSLYYYPSLKSGENKLTIIYKNESDNFDTTEYNVIVSNKLLVKDFYNYPNPMKEETNFVFNLIGPTTPKSCKIKIYTTAGRLIKEIYYSVNIGYNHIQWDGRDNDGDILANGTYLYKIVTEDDSKIETAIQKLVVLR